MRSFRSVGIIAFCLALGACGGTTETGSPPSSSPTATQSSAGHDMSGTCSPSGDELEIEAENTAFDPTCLATKAGAAATLKFKNRDGFNHNLEIFKDAAATQSVFKGDPVSGNAEATYNVPALAKGTYHFHCDFHPSIMQGTFVVA
jgi:plastocyanin